MSETKKHLSFATYIRAGSTILILLCHYTAESVNPYLRMTSQIFNIGVPLFLILSGFLAGYHPISDIYAWYLKKCKRILLPFWLFCVILALVSFLICNKDIFTNEWLFLLLGVQGSVVGVLGAEHTWFLTPLLISYIITPIIEYIRCSVNRLQSKLLNIICIIVLCVLPVIFSMFKDRWVFTIFSPVILYAISYIYGKCFTKHILNKFSWGVFSVIPLVFAIRFIFRIYIDGTLIYDRIIVTYTHWVAAGALFILCEYLCKDIKVPQCVVFIADISYEIYLYHYMFIVGPLSLFHRIDNWILSCIIVLVLVICIATIMHYFVTLIHKRLLRG